MRPWLTILGMLFWTVLLGIALRGFGLSFEARWLAGMTLGMILITWCTGRVARDPRRRPGVLVGGTILAALTMIAWFGVLGAGV